jgi:hypothetical protein
MAGSEPGTHVLAVVDGLASHSIPFDEVLIDVSVAVEVVVLVVAGSGNADVSYPGHPLSCCARKPLL